MCMREVKSDDRKKLHAETPPLEALKKGVEEPWTVERVTKFADLRLEDALKKAAKTSLQDLCLCSRSMQCWTTRRWTSSRR